MPLSHLEHFLVQTADIDRTCDWYERVLGLRRGATPDFKFPVQWLYLGDRDVIHVTEGGAQTSENRRRYLGQQSEALFGTGVIDHLAFRATGLAEMIDHLRALAVPFQQRRSATRGWTSCS
jgi:catechol 2,3-dioxygenase-like lactoylglutathione lyase family enzyme